MEQNPGGLHEFKADKSCKLEKSVAPEQEGEKERRRQLGSDLDGKRMVMV